MKINPLVKNLFISSSLLGGVLLSQTSYSETAVIIHPSNNIEISAKDIQRIFLGKSKTFPEGKKAVPIDQAVSSDTREKFNTKILKKNNRKLKTYWARRVFTGKGIPPKVVSSPEKLKKLVENNPNAISYVDDSLLDETVKVVYRF